MRNSCRCNLASIALGKSWSEAGGASISAAGALEVVGVSELIRRTLHSALVHIEEVAEPVDALAGLADCGGSAEGAGRTALSALIADGVGILSRVTGSSACCESYLKVGRGGALCACCSSCAEALETLGGASLALAKRGVSVVTIGTGAEALVAEEEQILRTSRGGAVFSDH